MPSPSPSSSQDVRGGPPSGASAAVIDAVIALCPLLGARPDQVIERPSGQIWLGGSGVMLVWRGTGWELRETYQIADGETSWRTVSRAVLAIPSDQPIRAAKAMAMLFFERRIDGLLGGGTRPPSRG